MENLHRAQELRRSQTVAEKQLWYHLRAHRFMGLKFKRQKPIGPYIVDFVCMEAGLIIEADGGQHMDQHLYDENRSNFLEKQGFKVLRFWNNEIMNNLPAVLEAIRLTVESRPSPPAPLPQAGEGSNAGESA